ncbi:glycosyltransferase [bacterium]|nr:glycosyltransferase [bacterium]
MTICFLCDNIIHPQIGGIERVTYSLTKQFQKLGVKVICIALREGSKAYKEQLDEDINQYVLPNNSNSFNTEDSIFLNDLLSKNKVDIIINQSTFNKMFELAVIAKNELGLKLISTLHTAPDALLKDIKDAYLKNNTGKSQLFIWVKKIWGYLKYPMSYYVRKKHLGQKYSKISNASDVVVLLSEHFKKKYIEIANINDSNKLHAISNPCSFNGEAKQLKKKDQLIYVGRMIYDAKRPDRLLKIWNKLHTKFPNWNLVLLGDGPDLISLKNRALKLKLKNIEFKGNVNPEKYYQKSKMVCLTSTYEGFGMVLTEGMQYGCVPVVYNSFESLADIIEDGINGFKVPPFKNNIFIEKLELLMNDESLRQGMAYEGDKINSKFSPEKISKQWLNLFDVLLNNIILNN